MKITVKYGIKYGYVNLNEGENLITDSQLEELERVPAFNADVKSKKVKVDKTKEVKPEPKKEVKEKEPAKEAKAKK